MNRASSFKDRVVLLVGSLGPLGHIPASGTVTVGVVGLPLFRLTHNWPPLSYVAATAGFVALSIWLHHLGDRILGEKDSSKLVWDELAGFLVAVALVPFTWQTALFAFLMERGLDITKFPPAGWVERSWPGAWGVVGDDIVAGLYTCGILHVVILVAPAWMGLNP